MLIGAAPSSATWKICRTWSTEVEVRLLPSCLSCAQACSRLVATWSCLQLYCCKLVCSFIATWACGVHHTMCGSCRRRVDEIATLDVAHAMSWVCHVMSCLGCPRNDVAAALTRCCWTKVCKCKMRLHLHLHLDHVGCIRPQGGPPELRLGVVPKSVFAAVACHASTHAHMLWRSRCQSALKR